MSLYAKSPARFGFACLHAYTLMPLYPKSPVRFGFAYLHVYTLMSCMLNLQRASALRACMYTPLVYLYV